MPDPGRFLIRARGLAAFRSALIERCLAGRPFDAESQRQTLELALSLLECAPAARTTVHSPQRWPVDGWKQNYLDLARLSADEIVERRKEFDAVKAVAKAKREGA